MYTQAQAGCSGASEGGRAWRAGRDIGTAFLPPSLACPNGTRAQRTFSAKELSSAAAASGAMALSLTTVGRQANALAPAKGGAGPDMGPRLCGHAVCCQAAGHQAADTGSCYGRSFAIDGPASSKAPPSRVAPSRRTPRRMSAGSAPSWLPPTWLLAALALPVLWTAVLLSHRHFFSAVATRVWPQLPSQGLVVFFALPAAVRLCALLAWALSFSGASTSPGSIAATPSPAALLARLLLGVPTLAAGAALAAGAVHTTGVSDLCYAGLLLPGHSSTSSGAHHQVWPYTLTGASPCATCRACVCNAVATPRSTDMTRLDSPCSGLRINSPPLGFGMRSVRHRGGAALGSGSGCGCRRAAVGGQPSSDCPGGGGPGAAPGACCAQAPLLRTDADVGARAEPLL